MLYVILGWHYFFQCVKSSLPLFQKNRVQHDVRWIKKYNSTVQYCTVPYSACNVVLSVIKKVDDSTIRLSHNLY